MCPQAFSFQEFSSKRASAHRPLARCRWWAVGVLLLAPLGCGGGTDVKLVRVTGRVLLDGEPVSNARVIFRPTDGGRLSSGVTEDDGSYELNYVKDQRGAIAGDHQVVISTFVEPDLDSSDPDRQAGQPERIPAIYNSKTTLQADVPAARKAELNFELDSNHEVSSRDKMK